MKKIITITAIILSCTFGFGQEHTGAIKVAPNEESGKTNGNKNIYYKNGSLKKSGKYNDNGNTGEWMFYTQNGDLEAIGHYLNGEKHGEWNNYYLNKKILQTGSYQKGKQVGEWKTYHPNGQLAIIQIYSNEGKEVGKPKFYNQNGNSIKKKDYDNEIKGLMKTGFEEFYTLLQQKDFDQAVNFVSEDYLDATGFSKEQMKNLLQSNFDNWEILPDLNVVLKEIEIQKPKKIIKKGNKSFGVLEAVMNFEMTVAGNYSETETELVMDLIEAIGKNRYKIGEISQTENKTVIQLKDKRLVACIYHFSSQKVSFAMAEKGLRYSFEKFLPKEIVEEMKSQL